MEHKNYFKSFEEMWNDSLDEVIKYIEKYNKKPTCHDKNKKIKILGKWIGTQAHNYAKNKKLMKCLEIRKKWSDFLSKYKEYFKSRDELWNTSFEKLKKYIDNNGKKPPTNDENIEIRGLGYWTSDQISDYKNKKNFMKNDEFRDKWYDLISKYKNIFKANEELWYETFYKVKEYIVKNKKRPSQHDKDKNISSLGSWISFQISKYSINKGIMKEQKIRKEWEKFIPEYKVYFEKNKK